MKEIYFDNSSTSFPKAPGLGKVMGKHIDYNGYNISRGNYSKAYSLEWEIIETREKINKFFNGEKAQNVIFTSGTTEGLNVVINGILKKGDHVITTSIEHSSVTRTLTAAKNFGVNWDEVDCDNEGNMQLEDISKLIKPETKMVLMTHGSNVCGTLTPIEDIGKICKKYNVFFCIDAAQTAGSVPIDMKRCQVDALAFSAHKGIMGPQGIGGILMSNSFAKACKPLVFGGTGSISNEDNMPDFLPDKFQPGTMNIPGIIGLKHAIDFIENEGVENIHRKKIELTKFFLNEVLNMNKVNVVGKKSTEGRDAVISLDFCGKDNSEVSYILEKDFGIMTRCGLHCAPHAHKTLGTFPKGTIRFSFGYFNTEAEIAYAVNAIRMVLREYL